MKKISVLIFVSLLIFALSTVAVAKTPQDLVAEWGNEVPHISGMELKMEMDFGEEFIIIDVRTHEEYAAGRIPGAIKVNFGRLIFVIGNIIEDKDTMFIVNCAVGARSTIATYLLHQLGYTNATNLQGGFRDWNNSGYPIETNHGTFIQY